MKNKFEQNRNRSEQIRSDQIRFSGELTWEKLTRTLIFKSNECSYSLRSKNINDPKITMVHIPNRKIIFDVTIK